MVNTIMKLNLILIVLPVLVIGDLNSRLQDGKLPVVAVEIENKSWFENQNSSLKKIGVHDNSDDVVVFEGVSWNPFNNCESCDRLSKYRTACRSNGEYLNLCGECVGGSSEKEDDFRLDSCGICSGLDRCAHTSCVDLLDDDYGTDKNCTPVITIRPNVIDIASSLTGMVHLEGNVDGDNYHCDIFKDAHKHGEGKLIESETGLVVEFELPQSEGRLELRCNSSSVIITEPLLIVDSRKLHPLSTNVKTIDYGKESKITLTIGSMYALADLLCYARDESGKLFYKAWSNNVQGNPLSSQVFCDRIWPRAPGKMMFGVAYSEEAIPETKTLDVGVVAKPLRLLRALLDKKHLQLTFDQTISEYTDCNEVFKDISSKDAKCWSVGNQLKVMFKKTPKIGDTLTVKCASAATGLQESFLAKIITTKVGIGISNHVSESLIESEIDGPDVVCSGQMVSFNVDSTVVKWSISTPTDGTNKGSITSGNQQRENLMLWRGLREAGKALGNNEGLNSRASLNTSLLTSGNEYQIRASVPDGKGKMMILMKNFRIIKGDIGQPSIKGPSQLSLTHDALYEMENPVCEPKNIQAKFEWSLDENGKPLMQREGSKMKLESGLLSFNAKYNLTLSLYNHSEIISKTVKELGVQPANSLKTPSYIEEIVFGTGQRIVLKGNPGIATTKAETPRYAWSCASEYGACLRPGKEKQQLETSGGFDRSILDLPPGSLPVGKYAFKLVASLLSGESTSKIIKVFIVPGEPTLLSLISVDFQEKLRIVLQAKDIIGECELYLESLRTINSTFLELDDIGKPEKIMGTPHSPLTKTLEFEIPSHKVIFGSLYVFRMMADCKGLSQSWLLFSVPLPELSSSCQLKVSPRSGEVLSTEFNFQATDCWPQNPVYSFGFKKSETTHFLTTTLEPMNKAFAFPGVLSPVMRLCESDKLCSFSYDTEIDVRGSSVGEAAIKSVLKLYDDNLKSGYYDEAISCSVLLLESCQGDETWLKNVSDSLLNTLMERIDVVQNSLRENNRKVSDAFEFLQCAMKIVKSTEASDEAISIVLELRDLIEQTSSNEDGSGKESTRTIQSKIKRATTAQKRNGRTTEDDVKQDLKVGTEILNTVKGRNREKNETEKFLKKVPIYVNKMCPSLHEENPFYFRSELMEISILKLKLSRSTNKIEKFFPDCQPGKCLNTSGKVVLSKAYWSSVLPNSSEICVGLNRYEEDLYSTAKNATLEPNMTRWSWVYASLIFKGNKVLTNDGANETHAEPLATLRFPIWNATLPGDSDLKCHMWKSDVGWDDHFCGPEKRVMLPKSIPAVECKCPFPGVYAIFAIPKTEREAVTSSPVKVPQSIASTQATATTIMSKATTQVPSTTGSTTVKNKPTITVLTTMALTSAKPTANGTAAIVPQLVTSSPNVKTPTMSTRKDLQEVTTSTPVSSTVVDVYKVSAAFIIDESYNQTVRDRIINFEDSLKAQLTELVKIPADSKVEAKDNNDKIKVTVKLKVGDKSDLPLLSKLLNSGELKLKGLDNRQMKVPKQNLEVSLALKGGGPSSLAVISSALFIALSFIIAIFLAGMFMKWKRQQRALSFVQNMEVSAPKYLRLQETSSTDHLNRSFGSSENLRSGELDSGIVLTVDPSRMSTKYRLESSSSNSRHTVA